MTWPFLLALLTLWVLFNWAAPFATLLHAERISHGRLPAELLVWDDARRVKFYMSRLKRGYGFSIWAPPWSVVVFDKAFFSHASAPLVRYVVAHELAHFSLGHHRKRWFAVVTGAALLPPVRRWLRRMEDEADAVAEHRTGYDRKQFRVLQ